MRDFSGKCYWIIGASEGLGRALAHDLAEAGARLVLSARHEDRLRSLQSELEPLCDAAVLPLDLRDQASVDAAFEALPDVDGIIYMAGAYQPMTVQEWEQAGIETMLDVNLNGAVRILSGILPRFLERDRGHIVLVGSLSAYRGLPGAIGYGVSKAALMHLAECLRIDLRDSAVEVQLVNPGFIETRLTAKNDFDMPFIMTPEEASKAMMKGISSTRFKTDFPWGFSLVFRIGRILPEWLWFRIFSRKSEGGSQAR
ncbi:SDR family NAD(P)-dependent oxidoreductase [Oceanomicrobium pacificus]|uniref:SDR family NAD(P)-dependent oxidoreductase n=1 Tax=Oceanomicrobium pacificus TaxID=2692916 RepID=A0A6B0TQI6_9RHOB|nr:SDR family NAD(P)-dependent oxidoreductase [Oceanomicrobium pacificus]MXU66216.1 SDR family NAD(P)-dependent oxidoreductase [Oceanomicrobium pacificus]